MKTELWYLTLVTVLTGLLFLPYVLDRIGQWGLIDTVGYPVNPKPLSPWAQRLMRAHANAVTATTQTTNRQTPAARCPVSVGRFLGVCSFGKFIDSGVRRRRVRVVSTDLR